MAQDLSGEKLGPYRLVEIIGRGGMGVVYRARQETIGRDVAIKLMDDRFVRNAALVERFGREAQATGTLQHPGILPLVDVGFEGCQSFIVTAYLSGGSLSARIAASPGGMPLMEVVRITSETAAALTYAHSHGVVHRDIKPGNILLDNAGHTCLSDFGIALINGVEEAGDAHVIGTYAYLAPEVAGGQPATPASDIYSLGVVIFEMLTGQRPFTVTDLASLREAHAEGSMLPDVCAFRPALPAGVAVVLRQALSRDPEARPATATALALALAHAAGTPDEAAHPDTHQPASPPLAEPLTPAPVDTPPPEVDFTDWPPSESDAPTQPDAAVFLKDAPPGLPAPSADVPDQRSTVWPAAEGGSRDISTAVSGTAPPAKPAPLGIQRQPISPAPASASGRGPLSPIERTVLNTFTLMLITAIILLFLLVVLNLRLAG
ncbi:MAG: protein kinase [Anaerolineae bacterium]|nr:protein kinase [Anaerolineae bacterium]